MHRVHVLSRQLVAAAEDAGEPPLLYAVEDGVAILTLNRPKRLNAWTAAMGRLYFNALERADADPAVKCVLVTGAGRGFCAGADMDLLGSIQSATEKKQQPGSAVAGAGNDAAATAPPAPSQVCLADADSVPDVPQIVALQLRKPLIAAINGACAGLGFVVALMADVRFSAKGAKFTTAFAKRGLVAEHGCSWLLPKVVGTSRALDLLLSARVLLADEAAAMGLVNFVHDDAAACLAAAKAYCVDLARNVSPASMAAIKAQIHAH